MTILRKSIPFWQNYSSLLQIHFILFWLYYRVYQNGIKNVFYSDQTILMYFDTPLQFQYNAVRLYSDQLYALPIWSFTFIHLADAFFQSNLQISKYKQTCRSFYSDEIIPFWSIPFCTILLLNTLFSSMSLGNFPSTCNTFWYANDSYSNWFVMSPGDFSRPVEH